MLIFINKKMQTRFLHGKLFELEGLKKAGWWPISRDAFEVTFI